MSIRLHFSNVSLKLLGSFRSDVRSNVSEVTEAEQIIPCVWKSLLQLLCGL